jgi:hypothetical protein
MHSLLTFAMWLIYTQKRVILSNNSNIYKFTKINYLTSAH